MVEALLARCAAGVAVAEVADDAAEAVGHVGRRCGRPPPWRPADAFVVGGGEQRAEGKGREKKMASGSDGGRRQGGGGGSESDRGTKLYV